MKRRTHVAVILVLFAIIAIIVVIAFSSSNKTVHTETNTEIISENQKEMKTSQKNDGGWGDAETTALTTYTLLEGGTSPNAIYQNAEGTNVSIANQNVSNAASYLWCDVYNDEDSQNITITATNAWFTSTTTVALNLVVFDGLHSAQNITFTSSAPDQVMNDSISSHLQCRLTSWQSLNGSWNNSVTDTALAVYALKKSGYGNETVISRGTDWLQGNGELATSSKDIALTIIALNKCGLCVDEYIDALAEKQGPDGSFGSVEDTSWAVIAISKTDLNNVAERRDKSLTWLKNQKIITERERALTTLAFIESNEIVEYSGSGPPAPNTIYLLSILIFGALLIAFGLFARIDESKIFEGVRKNIYEYIKLHPGEHLNRIMKTFKMSPGSVMHHLNVLEKSGRVVSYKNDRYRRFYVNGNEYKAYTNGCNYNPIISVLKNNTSRRITRFLLSNQKTNQKSLAEKLHIHPSTVNWHAKRLRNVGLLSRMRNGKEILYAISPDVEKIYEIL